MRVAIIGYATDGRVNYEYFAKQGHEVTICDAKQDVETPAGALTQLGADYLKDLDRFDVIVRSSGINPEILLKDNPNIKPKITTAVNEFLRVCPTNKTIGVTGTKGKGTTSTLITKMLEAAGNKVWLAGNIGWSPLQYVDQISPDDFVVLELSSFQLCDLTNVPHTAVCLMVAPEHIDWHGTLDNYILAKAQLFEHQTSRDTAIFHATNDLTRTIVGYGDAFKIPYFADPGAYVQHGEVVIADQSICKTTELKLLGEHNWQNVCAAVTVVWQFTQNIEAMRSVLTSFSGLEHRIEFVRSFNDVAYYDDSFGTTPETAIVAIQAFTTPKVVILGGSIKGSSFDQLAGVVANSNVRHVILIGSTDTAKYPPAAYDIKNALAAQGYTSITSLVRPGGPSMTEIVQLARATAEPGDTVLLSTACASFDMFTDYKDRGNQFKEVVRALV